MRWLASGSRLQSKKHSCRAGAVVAILIAGVESLACSQADSPLRRNAISVAWGVAGDEEAGWGGASVDGLMVLAGGDFEAFPGVEDDPVVVDFED